MEYEVTVIGGGIVGLATAYQILLKKPGTKICVLEKESSVALHQTGHNSGVIHSGVYYKPRSLKAQNCILGYKMLLEFCKANEIPFDQCGKIIAATNESELIELYKLYERGIENGLSKISIISKDEALEIEPHLNIVQGIKVPYTGIVDYSAVCKKLSSLIKSMGGEILLNFKVKNINLNNYNVNIESENALIVARNYINCAGLYSDKIANLTEKKIDTRIIPFRGEYYKLKSSKKYLVNNLIYPVPDPNFPFLGVHFTKMINGEVEAGPNAVFAFKREGYQKCDINLSELIESLSWPGFQKVMMKNWKTGIGEFYRSYSKKAFTKALQKLIPEIQEDDLLTAESGVRAQACDRFGGLIDDFKIIENKRAIHILNAPSPAATSCLAIGSTIANKQIKRLTK